MAVPPFLVLLLYYLAVALFVYPDWVNIGSHKFGDERVVVALFGLLPYTDISLLLILGFAVVFDGNFRALLASKPIVAFIIFLAIFAVLGVIFRNSPAWLRVDLRIWGWFFGGLALFRTGMNLRRPSLHILALCLVAGVILYLSAAAGRHNTMSTERLWDLNVFNYAGMMLPLLGLVFGLLAMRNFWGFLSVLLVFFLFFYGAIIVGATRSLALSVLVVCLSASVGLLFSRTKSVITSSLSPRAAWIGLCLLVAGVAVIATLTGAVFTESTVLANRLSDSQDIDSGLDRLVELEDAFKQAGFKILVGGGLGYTFESIFGYTAVSTHIAIFNFLFKFGAVPFLLIVIFLYVYLPVRFLLAAINHPTLSPYDRTAHLIVLPGVFSWLSILILSGGYDVYYTLGIGVSVGAFMEIKNHGLEQLCR